MKMSKLITFLTCLFFLLAFSVSHAFWTGSVTDDSISHYNPDSVYISDNNATIGVDSQGNLYAVWSQARYGTDRGLRLSKSTDGGQTWSARTFGDQLIASADGDVVPATGCTPIDIAFDSYDNIYVVWAEDLTTTTEIMLIKSTDSGQTWEHSEADWPISYDGSPYNDAKKPAIAIDGDDNVHVVWYEQNTWEIFYSRSEDYGDSWTGQTVNRTISYHDADTAWLPDIAIDSNNDIYVIWIEGSIIHSEPQCLHYGKSTDGGQTFNSETADYPITGAFTSLVYNPSITIDPSNNIHVVCSAKGPGDAYSCVFYTRSTDGGADWSGLSDYQYVDRGPAFGYDIYMSPSIAATSTGALCVVWSQEGHPISPTIQQIWASYSADAGMTWTGNVSADTVSFNEGANYAVSPVIINAPGDTLHVVWEEAITSGKEVHYSRSDTLATGVGPGCDFTPGDANGDGNVMGNDVTYSVRYFKGLGNPPPDSCWNDSTSSWLYSGGDANGNCSYTGSDVTYLVAYFKGYNPEIFYCPQTPPAEPPIVLLKE